MRFRSVPTMLSALLTGVSSAIACAGALAATELPELGPDTREEIARRCLPLQYREGTTAYRNCVTEEAALRAATGGSPLDALSFDERYAVYRSCPDAATRVACIERELTSLDGVPAPFLGALGRDERAAIGRECAGPQERDGVAAYRRCLGDALAALEALPVPDLEASRLTERNALGLRCTASARTAAGYRRCLLEATGVAVTAPDDVEPPAVAATPEPPAATAPLAAGENPEADGIAPDIADEAPAPPSESERAETAAQTPAETAREVVAPADAAADDTVVIEAETEEPDLGQRLRDARARLEATISDLDGMERIVLGVALGLPLLLLIGWMAVRGTRRRPASDDDIASHRNDMLAERVRESRRRRDARALPPDDASDVDIGWEDERLAPGGTQSARSPLWDEDELDDTVPSGFPAAPAPLAGHDPHDDRNPATGHDPRALPGERAADGAAREPLPIGPASTAPGVRGAGAAAADEARPEAAPAMEPRSSFGRWLLDEDETLRRQRAIEFLVYWMAYGDERYDPLIREALLRGDECGDPHDLIKRWVLERDVLAFSDAIRWLQANATEPERVQILDLLMALLISENAMTPVQNTLLRFLADAFGIGVASLAERHEIAFGTPLPDLPRVDLPSWWESVEPARLPLWDARALAALGEHHRHRARLGLPLSGEISEGEIIASFRRAARRCHPHRFDALGERERALAERQFGKFEEARDRLLGVAA